MGIKTWNPHRRSLDIYVDNSDENGVARAISKLKHQTSQLLKEVKERRYHTPRSVARRMAKKAAIQKEKMRNRAEKMEWGF